MKLLTHGWVLASSSSEESERCDPGELTDGDVEFLHSSTSSFLDSLLDIDDGIPILPTPVPINPVIKSNIIIVFFSDETNAL